MASNAKRLGGIRKGDRAKLILPAEATAAPEMLLVTPGTVNGVHIDQLIAKLQEGDATAFEPIYRKYQGQLYRYLYIKLPTARDAEDVLELVFTNAWQYINSYDRNKPFVRWLFGIAHNEMADFYRQRDKYWEYTDVEAIQNLTARSPSPEAEAISRVLSRQAYQALSDEQRQVVELRLAGVKTQEIQQIMNLPTPQAVNQAWYRAHKVFLKYLVDNGGI